MSEQTFRVGQKVRYKVGRGYAVGTIASGPDADGYALVRTVKGANISRKVSGLEAIKE